MIAPDCIKHLIGLEHHSNRSIHDLQGEFWVPIIGWEEFYVVSGHGRIKRLLREDCNNQFKGDMIISQKINSRGYAEVALHRKGRKTRFGRVARIVCEAFHPNPEMKEQVNHKNGLKTDNSLTNLEWSTASENQLHSVAVLGKQPTAYWTGRLGKDHHACISIECVETGEIFHGICSTANHFRVATTTLHKACNDSSLKIQGLTLRFKNKT